MCVTLQWDSIYFLGNISVATDYHHPGTRI